MENSLVSLNRVFLNLNNPAAQHGLVFNKGDILRGLVQDIDTNETVRVLIQGQLIEVFAEAKVTIGQNLHLLVEEVQPGRITLKVLTPEALNRIEQANLASQLRDLGIPPSESNVNLARSLLENQLPVNRIILGQAAQVLQHLGANTAENTGAAALAVKYNLPINQALLERLVSFFNSNNSFADIFQQLSRLLEQSPQMKGTAVRFAGMEADAVRYEAAGQPVNSSASLQLNPPLSNGPLTSRLPDGTEGGARTSAANQIQLMGTASETTNINQNPIPGSASSTNHNPSANSQPWMKGTANPNSSNFSWPQSGDAESILKLWTQIQILLENSVVKGDTPAPQIQGQLQQWLQSRFDLLQGWVITENLLTNAASGENHPLQDMLAMIRTLEHEISGQQIVNTISRFSAETTFPGIYLAFPLKLEQHQYTMCELRLNRESRQMSRQDDSMQIAVSLDTNHMGLVLFHISWKRSGTLDVQAVVEKDSVRQFFLNNWAELSRSLEQLGYHVNNLGIKVVDDREEIDSLRPSLQAQAALNIRPISIDITI